MTGWPGDWRGHPVTRYGQLARIPLASTILVLGPARRLLTANKFGICSVVKDTFD